MRTNYAQAIRFRSLPEGYRRFRLAPRTRVGARVMMAT
jgi:hypothetical protein